MIQRKTLMIKDRSECNSLFDGSKKWRVESSKKKKKSKKHSGVGAGPFFQPRSLELFLPSDEKTNAQDKGN